jgi:glycolate oxidase subunit GlcD
VDPGDGNPLLASIEFIRAMRKKVATLVEKLVRNVLGPGEIPSGAATATPATAGPVAAGSPFDELSAWIPRERIITDPTELRVYECDGLPVHREAPAGVVLCASREEVIQAVKWCGAKEIPFVARGAGTGLSGGATPVAGGLVIDTNRMRRILKVDIENRFAVVEPGVINIRVTEAVEGSGFHYAPDPSSQKACTLGGNIAENSGGPHCLKYGMTTDHILGLEVVLPGGEAVRFGGPLAEHPGLDITGFLVGAEGTCGVVVEATVRILPRAQAVRTFLAIFSEMAPACRMVAEVTRSGILPAAMEILDRNTIRAVEASVYAAGYPAGAGAVLLIEIDGFEAGLDEDEAAIREFAAGCGAIEFRAARDAVERAKLWKGRKGAFGAMGRVNTDLYVLDGVVPRTRLEETLEKIYRIAERHRVMLSNVFHAGDGNLHPNLSYDGRDAEETARVLAAGAEILSACVEAGGSVSGEHGIGIEKKEFLPLLFSAEDLALMADLREVFDPRRLSNPGKVFPDSKGCFEASKRHRSVAWRSSEDPARPEVAP